MTRWLAAGNRISIDALGSITVANGGVLGMNTEVDLNAGYVKLGTDFAGAQNLSVTPLTGLFTGGASGGTPVYLMPQSGAGNAARATGLELYRDHGQRQ